MMSDAALGLLGLGAKAGTILIGTGSVRAELQRNRVRAVVVACDLSDRTADKVVRLASAKGIPVVEGPTAAELGRRLGRGAVQAVGVTDRRLAEGLLTKLGRRTVGGLSGD
ncbi:MAG TPA: ribosomal L7Ae/L30e/S12e/Gadd45 family protein [Gemmatimonadales bacterium]